MCSVESWLLCRGLWLPYQLVGLGIVSTATVSSELTLKEPRWDYSAQHVTCLKKDGLPVSVDVMEATGCYIQGQIISYYLHDNCNFTEEKVQTPTVRSPPWRPQVGLWGRGRCFCVGTVSLA